MSWVPQADDAPRGSTHPRWLVRFWRPTQHGDPGSCYSTSHPQSTNPRLPRRLQSAPPSFYWSPRSVVANKTLHIGPPRGCLCLQWAPPLLGGRKSRLSSQLCGHLLLALVLQCGGSSHSSAIPPQPWLLPIEVGPIGSGKR